MISFLSRLATGAALLSLLPGGVVAQEGSPFGFEVVEVSFEGNQAFTDEELSGTVLTRATECRSVFLQPFCLLGSGFAQNVGSFSPNYFAEDRAFLLRYYLQRGYREASVDTASAVDWEREEVRVTFILEEGRPVLIDSLAIHGLAEFEPALTAGLPIETGDPLDVVRIEAARDSLIRRLQNRGYARAEVLRGHFIPNSAPYTAEVNFDVAPGPLTRFGEITVQGNEKLSDQTVMRMLPFQPGDLYSRSAIFEGQRNLYNLELVSFATVTAASADTVGEGLELPPDPATDTLVPIAVQVTEGDLRRVRAGSGWSSAECFSLESAWTSRNFFGGARRLQLRGRLSNLFAQELHDGVCPQAGSGEFAELNWLVSAELRQPWIFSPKNSFDANVFAERQSVTDVFVREAVGVTASLSRTIGLRAVLSLSFRPQLSRLDAAEIFFCTSALVCDPDDIDVLQGANWLSPAALSFSVDRTDQLLNPRRGYTGLLDLEYAESLTGSDFAYLRLVGEGTWHRPLGERIVVAARARGGWLSAGEFEGIGGSGAIEVAHPQKRFYSGGSNSVRGFAQNRLGPRILTIPIEDLVDDRAEAPPVCVPAEIVDLSCDASPLPDGLFSQRATGGTRLAEANVELRFGLWSPQVEGAVFVDAGQVWNPDEGVSLGDLEVTPGFGIRYFTPIGPIRVDLGYRFRGERDLSVVTSRIRPFVEGVDDPDDRLPGPGDTRLDWVRTDELALLGPAVLFGDTDRWSFSRLQLHFSIGQAF